MFYIKAETVTKFGVYLHELAFSHLSQSTFGFKGCQFYTNSLMNPSMCSRVIENQQTPSQSRLVHVIHAG